MKKIIILCSILLTTLFAAQNGVQYLQQIQIKSPETNSFDKYGNIPVNLYTGMIDMQIPLCNLPIDNDNSVNVMLTYDSSGFIPHKKGDLAGTGWSLVAGGRITRTVKGRPDEYEGDPMNANQFGQFGPGQMLNGYLKGIRLNPPTNNAEVYNLYSGIGGINGSDWRLGSAENGYEGEPDLFSFSIMGLSGKFMIGNDGKAVVESNDPNIKIDLSGLATYGEFNDCKLSPSKIIMKDGKGNTYYFGGDFSKYEVSYMVPSYNGPDDNQTKKFYTVNSWSIDKIIFNNGKTISFNYVQDTLHEQFCQRDIALTIAKNAKILSMDAFYQDGFNSGYYQNCGNFSGCLTSTASGSSNSTSYVLLKRSLLESINFNDLSVFIKYKDTGYPIIHDQSATKLLNEFVIGDIMLKQGTNIIKQYQFNYADYGGINKRPFLTNLTELKSNSTYFFEYHNKGNLPKYYTNGIDHWGFWNGKDSNTSLLAYDNYNETTGDYTLNNTIRDPETSLYNVGLLKKVIYPTKGYTFFEYEPQSYGKRIERTSTSNFLPVLMNNSGNIGGARIKRQYDYAENGGIVNEKEYQYVTTLNGNVSSGILMNWPRYVYYIEWRGPGYFENMLLKSSTNVQQNSLDNYNIGYSRVFEINKNKGYIEHNFYSYEDYPDIFNSGEPNIRNYFDNLPNSSSYPSYPENLYKNFRNLYATDRSIMRGKPKSEIIFSQNSANPIRMMQYIYNDNTDYNPNSMQDNNNYVSINHLTGFWVQGYKKYFNSSSLKKKISTDYLDGASILNTTEYFFDSPNNLNLSREIFYSSSNDSFSTNYYYVQDLNPINTIMQERNMLGIPLIVIENKNGKPVRKSETNYPESLPTPQTGNLVLPLSEKSYDLKNNSESITELTYDHYDSKGNLLQYKTKSGTPMAIVWGYNSTKPIAKIEGATYQQVVSEVTDIVAASNADANAAPLSDESSLLAQMSAFRKKTTLLPYSITTYTYDPLIGLRSMTPPSGITEFYNYDSANRLKEIRNANGHLVKEFKYHYAPLTFYNSEQSKVFQRNNCGPDHEGGYYTYIVPAKKYFSLISQEDAEQKATDDINANGQNAANANAPCNHVCHSSSGNSNIINCLSYAEEISPNNYAFQISFTIVQDTRLVPTIVGNLSTCAPTVEIVNSKNIGDIIWTLRLKPNGDIVLSANKKVFAGEGGDFSFNYTK